MTATTETPKLGARLLAVAAEVEKIKATGTNQFQTKAISIQDVEDALRDLFAKHGILTIPSWHSPAVDVGNGKLWLADIDLKLENANDSADFEMARICDIGTSPSAAESFALKRFYKAVFHLADEDDDTRGDAKDDKPAARRAAPKADSSKAADKPKTAPKTEMTADQKADVLFLNEQLGDKKRTTAQLTASLKEHGAVALIEILAGDHFKQHGAECAHYTNGSDGGIVVKRG